MVNTVDGLCFDTWSHVFSFLTVAEVRTMACGSRTLAKIAEDPLVWEMLFHRDAPQKVKLETLRDLDAAYTVKETADTAARHVSLDSPCRPVPPLLSEVSQITPLLTGLPWEQIYDDARIAHTRAISHQFASVISRLKIFQRRCDSSKRLEDWVPYHWDTKDMLYGYLTDVQQREVKRDKQLFAKNEAEQYTFFMPLRRAQMLLYSSWLPLFFSRFAQLHEIVASAAVLWVGLFPVVLFIIGKVIRGVLSFVLPAGVGAPRPLADLYSWLVSPQLVCAAVGGTDALSVVASTSGATLLGAVVCRLVNETTYAPFPQSLVLPAHNELSIHCVKLSAITLRAGLLGFIQCELLPFAFKSLVGAAVLIGQWPVQSLIVLAAVKVLIDLWESRWEPRTKLFLALVNCVAFYGASNAWSNNSGTLFSALPVGFTTSLGSDFVAYVGELDIAEKATRWSLAFFGLAPLFERVGCVDNGLRGDGAFLAGLSLSVALSGAHMGVLCAIFGFIGHYEAWSIPPPHVAVPDLNGGGLPSRLHGQHEKMTRWKNSYIRSCVAAATFCVVEEIIVSWYAARIRIVTADWRQCACFRICAALVLDGVQRLGAAIAVRVGSWIPLPFRADHLVRL